MFDLPRADQFTQGTIFSCGYAESYSAVSIYGLVITARCDAAQDKAPIYSFVPVVSLKEWVVIDGAQIILDRHRQDLWNSRKNILVGMGLSDSLLRTKSPEQIIESHLKPLASADKRLESKLRAFQEQSVLIGEICSVLSSKDRTATLSLLKRSSKYLDNIVKELAGNRLLGHYLLRKMPRLYDDVGSDHVALLREIHHIPSALAKQITQGIAKPLSGVEPNIETKCPRYSDEDDYCAPVARLKSPWMEHLMQSLTLLFSRIGVEDIDAASVKKSLQPLGLDR